MQKFDINPTIIPNIPEEVTFSPVAPTSPFHLYRVFTRGYKIAIPSTVRFQSLQGYTLQGLYATTLHVRFGPFTLVKNAWHLISTICI